MCEMLEIEKPDATFNSNGDFSDVNLMELSH